MDYETIPIEEFDRLARANEFAEGPEISQYGDGYGDPYMPNREVLGTLKDGRRVRATKSYGTPASETDRGLYQKFEVTRTDGSSGRGGRHEHCEYFVLDITHDPFAFPALLAYAAACRAKFPKLADDLERKCTDVG